jgi:hypothetical protein
VPPCTPPASQAHWVPAPAGGAAAAAIEPCQATRPMVERRRTRGC